MITLPTLVRFRRTTAGKYKVDVVSLGTTTTYEVDDIYIPNAHEITLSRYGGRILTTYSCRVVEVEVLPATKEKVLVCGPVLPKELKDGLFKAKLVKQPIPTPTRRLKEVI